MIALHDLSGRLYEAFGVCAICSKSPCFMQEASAKLEHIDDSRVRQLEHEFAKEGFEITSYKDALHAFKKWYVDRAVERTGGIKQAARSLNVARSSVSRVIHRNGDNNGNYNNKEVCDA